MPLVTPGCGVVWSLKGLHWWCLTLSLPLQAQITLIDLEVFKAIRMEVRLAPKTTPQSPPKWEKEGDAVIASVVVPLEFTVQEAGLGKIVFQFVAPPLHTLPSLHVFWLARLDLYAAGVSKLQLDQEGEAETVTQHSGLHQALQPRT